jgi:hypothetical protein
VRPAGQPRVTGREERQVVEVRAAKAQRGVILHQQQVAVGGRRASSARPRIDRGDHNQIGGLVLLLGQAGLLALRQLR